MTRVLLVSPHRAGQGAFAVMVGLSLVVLFSPASAVPGGINISDKLVHLLLFVALAVTGRLAKVPPVRLVFALAAYAGVSETLQSVLPIGRDGDILDALADSLGVLLGLGAVQLSRRRSR